MGRGYRQLWWENQLTLKSSPGMPLETSGTRLLSKAPRHLGIVTIFTIWQVLQGLGSVVPFRFPLREGDSTPHFGGYGDGSSDVFVATLAGANGYRVVTSSAVQTITVNNNTEKG